MMIKFTHAVTGGVMYVAEDRVEEYKAAGHKLAADVTESGKGKKTKKDQPKGE